MTKVYLGLGTNLGDRFQNLYHAREYIKAEDIRIEAESTIDETDPVDFLNQPKFLNQIILVSTALAPRNLLNVLNRIEQMMGRIPSIDKGPRLIDIDILLYNNDIINEEGLTIPHPEIRNRDFVMKHLVELNPQLRDPVHGDDYLEVLHGKEKNNKRS
jgi:dihydroneopterin aldolase / 2-amino-4-hydroxy-6-hydroxymethyldihydropteridine diphosphokinase